MGKEFVFAGIFLAGLLMFGLVSGAGYNVVVPSATTPPSSSGGGGGGTSGGAIIYTVSDEQFTQGYTKALRVKDGLRFSVAGESHYLKMNSLTASTISINITSELQQATLSAGDVRRFELSGDNYYDLSVTLNSINVTTSKAEITILSINTEVTDETIAEEQDKEKAAQEKQAGEDELTEKESSNFLMWVIIIILVLVVALAAYFKRKKK